MDVTAVFVLWMMAVIMFAPIFTVIAVTISYGLLFIWQLIVDSIKKAL